MAVQNGLFYLGSRKIVEAGGSLRFKLAKHVFHDEDAAILPWETEEDLFYAHDHELGFLVARSAFAADGRFWFENPKGRYVSLEKPTENIRRLAIVKPVRENPGGPVNSVEWEFAKGDTVHYVTTEKMATETPKSFYILDTRQLEQLIHERGLTWKREVDTQRLRKNGFYHLADLGSGDEIPTSLEQIEKSPTDDHEPANSEVEVRQIEVQIANISREVYSIIDIGYLLVRFVADKVVVHGPDALADPVFTTQNEEIPVESDYQNQTVEATIPIRIHREYPTEFKLYVDVDESDRLEDVRAEFASSPSCRSASLAGAPEDRVYFLLNEFGITKTPDGYVNNVVYAN